MESELDMVIAMNNLDATRRTKEEALTVPEQATALIVSSNEQYAQGEGLLATCKQLETEIHATFDPIVDKALSAHKEAVAQRKKYLDPIETGRRILKGKMIAYQDEQERIRREAQAAAEAAAKKRAEDDALAAALQAEQEGDKETAAAILAEPITAPPVYVPKTAPAASRLSAGRSTWSASVFSLKDLCRAVADGIVSTEYVMGLTKNKDTGVITCPALNSRASGDKSMFRVPGVRAVEKRV